MLKEFIITLLTIVVFACANTVTTPYDTTTVGPRDRRSPDCGCDRQNFEKARSCCALPNLFSEASMTQCADAIPQFFAMTKQFMNRMLNKMKKSMQKGRRTKRHGGPGGPDMFMCALQAEGLINATGELDLDLFKTKFYANSTTEWQTVYDKAVTDCKAAQSNASMSVPSFGPFNPMTMMMLKCMRKELMMNCPTASINTTDATCPDNLASLSTCNPFTWAPRFPGAMGGGMGGPMGGAMGGMFGPMGGMETGMGRRGGMEGGMGRRGGMEGGMGRRGGMEGGMGRKGGMEGGMGRRGGMEGGMGRRGGMEGGMGRRGGMETMRGGIPEELNPMMGVAEEQGA